MTQLRQISYSQKISGLPVLARQGYGLFPARICFKSQWAAKKAAVKKSAAKAAPVKKATKKTAVKKAAKAPVTPEAQPTS